ncbi:hypothetical protein SLG_31400 [Sphingobium sp. SYK-6]|uniref:DUF1552 domain-containing protein n=1 Tax=Sphingobium sp. (strain NBRC 103272 / SYK-6) TaxID=627192 RepID=UPI00022775A7|nr:DUF1552 domain-containing protein [Sphingobium sp. SYK-6]BAK67815.1 hypothetical protein SLG_31400 [Sphingobium sp. SYK-6]
MHYITKKHLSRRTLLRGFGGAALALPFLESMLPAATNVSGAASRTRLGFYYVPHGAVMDKWTPATDGTDFAMSPTLRSLEPYRPWLNVISDMGLPLAYTEDGSAAAHHSSSCATYLSGAAMHKNENRLGITIDQLAARKIGQETPLPSLELGIEGSSATCGEGWSCAYRDSLAWSDEHSPLPVERNPQVVFERLFGDGRDGNARAANRQQAASILDGVLEQTSSLQRNLPAADRRRLDQYLTDVREVERRVALAEQQASSDLDLPPTPVGIPADFEDHIKMLFDLQVLAWQTEMTRISTLMVAVEISNAIYPKSGVREAFHPLSHHSNIQANKDKLAQLNAYHVSMFAYLLEKMKSTPDGDGSLLDNSILMWGSGMGDSNVHNHDPVPIVMAGGGSGSIKGNRHIRSGSGKRPLSNLLLTILQKANVNVDKFGDSTGTVDL